LPQMPTGAAMDFKTRYRIIEYDPEGSKNGTPEQVNIYDADKIRKTNPGKLNIYPPVYYQQYGLGKWWKGIERTVVHNLFVPELVLIIQNGNVLKVSRMKEHPKILGTIEKERYVKGDREIIALCKVSKMTSDQAKKTIITKLKHRDVWSLSIFPYKDGEIVCGYCSVMPKAIAVWWVGENGIRNVNGVARANTPHFELGFEISASEGYDFCAKKASSNKENDPVKIFWNLLSASVQLSGAKTNFFSAVSGANAGTVRITVTDKWHYLHKQQRLQLAQSVWEMWARVYSPQDLDKARISLVDYRGNEVGGSRVFGGSLIWVQD
jgi:hypothetical protein